MPKRLSTYTAIVRFWTGSRKIEDDATNRVEVVFGNERDDNYSPPAQRVWALVTPAKTGASSVEEPEPAFDDRSFARLRDEKAAGFAIACFLAQKLQRNLLVASALMINRRVVL